MLNTVYLIDSCSITVKDFFESEIPGSVYDDASYTLVYNNETYDVLQCEIVGFDLGDICAYRLLK